MIIHGRTTPKSASGGYSLMEILMAIATFSVGILAFANLQGHLARSNLDARMRTLASNLAEAQLESQKRFMHLYTSATEDPDNDVFDYQDVATGTHTKTVGDIEFEVSQTVTDYYWDESTETFVSSAPAGEVFSDFKMVSVTVSWDGMEFAAGDGRGGSSELGSGSVSMSTVISSRVTGTNHLALIDELGLGSAGLCVPLVSCPGAP